MSFIAAGSRYLVTGATSGIGKAVVEALLENGATVLGIGREADKVAAITESYHQTFEFHSLDLCQLHLIEDAISKYIGTGKFDGFIHCAGRDETTPLPMCNEENISNLFKINVFSGIELLRVFSKKRFSNDGSSIVFISSVMAELGHQGKIGYCATKAAITGVVRAAALELSKRRIRVNAISPAIVVSPMSDMLLAGTSHDEYKEINKMHPTGFGTTMDVVPMILFLLSANSKWITGQNIKIDGGYSIK
ncbi:SDR family oxidoreductase [Daejeonella sp. JGW-45]|uniref:SDR family NAD(P)-dependent oxidoreductase n=1 Tax=Daejeonella sp. JGW-45 TaxID=3034148 RepID=UPI0023EB0544|nr:SDR family oxidoreductase [Daejeonella sp. JGW-45]